MPQNVFDSHILKLPTYMSCIYVALLLFKTSDLIYHKTAFNQGKVTKFKKCCWLCCWLLQYCFSLDSLFSLRHLEFHFRFEKNRHFWRVIKQWNNQNKETRYTRTVIQFSHENKSNKTSREWHRWRSMWQIGDIIRTRVTTNNLSNQLYFTLFWLLLFRQNCHS